MEDGLTGAEAARRLAADGPNALPAAQARGTAAIALGVLREPMFLLLVAATAVYLVVGDLGEALILAASIAGVIALAVVQERKAERALEALRDLSSPRALVIRDGERVRISGRDVVRGDLLLVAEGDRVAADAELLQAIDLTLDESLLTGESLPVARKAGDPIHSGALVVAGQGRAVVTATGAKSELGRIGASLATLESGKTSLETETARIVRWVAGLAVALSLLMAAAWTVLRNDWLEGVLAGLTLAMAIIPEEFPVVLTVFLALGAWRISAHGVLTRRMPAIEMLGAATVLCVDKTGTLTENRMSVVDTPAGVIDLAALACELDAYDPMENAIVSAASPDAQQRRKAWRLAHDYPFGNGFLAVCHVWVSPDGVQRVAIKGAPETVLSLCGATDRMPLVHEYTSMGRRVLAVAEAPWEGAPLDDPRGYPFRFAGLLQLADPLRATVPDAVAQCRRAGIRVVMITGDFPGTAAHIAGQAGIPNETVVSGADIEGVPEEKLTELVRKASVFARVRPEQKLRLVQAYRAAGDVVAMTGDGVNDAPALKAAHIGIAMGKRGTDVARESAALVLLEDDFGSIVRTVRLGRRIYENIRNAMRYLVSVHVPIAGMSFVPVMLGGPLFLMPVHVVFLEFVIDPACTLVFEGEHTEAGTMERPPRKPGEPLFGARMLGLSVFLGAAMLASVLAVYWWALSGGRPEGAVRAIAFTAIVFGNLALLYAMRSSTRTILELRGRENRAFWWIGTGALAALALAVYFPPLAGLFRFSPLGWIEVGAAALAGAAGVAPYEAWKLLRRT